MSRALVFNLERSWTYVASFYGIDAAVLAAYNGAWEADLDAPLPRGTKLKIPNAVELTNFYPTFAKRFGTQTDNPLILPPPTRVVSIDVTRAKAADDLLDADNGNPVIVNAARMRRFGHTGDNYEPITDAYAARLRSPNPEHEGNTAGPDIRAIPDTEYWFKCNVFVGDTLYVAGYQWPMSKFKRYIQPENFIETLASNDLYAKTVFILDAFKGGKIRLDAPPQEITPEDLADVRPGDVIALHGFEGDLPRHSAIVTSKAVVDNGILYLRIVDIYGEQLIEVQSCGVVAVFRPTRKRWVPAQTVGGNVNNPTQVLDGEGLNGEGAEDLPDTYKREYKAS